MPDQKVAAGELRRTSLSEGRRGVHDNPLQSYEAQDSLDPLLYLLVLRDSWRAIALVFMIAIVATLVVTIFVMSKSYKATTILRPIPKSAMQGRLSGMTGGLSGGFGSMAGLISGVPGSDEAQEDMTILKSFSFNTALVEKHNLAKEFSKRSTNWVFARLDYDDPRWRAYTRIMRKFSCEFSNKEGNLTLSYEAKSPNEAERILGYYVDDLREKLRSREVQGADEAIDSMKQEARVTSDVLLQTQLYELIAKQLQQVKLAQVQADFAFTVLDPPIAPDKPSHPKPLLDCAIVAFLSMMVASTVVLFVHAPYLSRPEIHARYRQSVENQERKMHD